MLGIDTKREIITGESARKTWSEVLAMWLKGRTVQAEKINQQNEVELENSHSPLYDDVLHMGVLA